MLGRGLAREEAAVLAGRHTSKGLKYHSKACGLYTVGGREPLQGLKRTETDHPDQCRGQTGRDMKRPVL